MADVIVAIGDLATRVVTDDPSVIAVVLDRYRGFVTQAGARWTWRIAARATGLVDKPDIAVRRLADGRLEVERHDFIARLDLERREAEVALGAIDAIAIDTVCRVTYSFALLAEGGFLVHAASLVREGVAYLFPGPSGAGKTTLARLSPDALLLSDEISLVRLDYEGARCYGTPFWGELQRGGENRRAPLRAVYFPRQAAAHARRRLSAGVALRRLLPNVVFFARDAVLGRDVLQLAAALAETVPVFELDFRRDAEFWRVVDAA